MSGIQKMNLKRLIAGLAVLALSISGCSQTAGTSGSEQTSLKPQMKLLSEKSMGSVSEDKIPDVTAERWSFEAQYNRPIVTPAGRHVLVVGEDKMSWIETSTGKELWSKATYGGIDSYFLDDDRIYMNEKYANKKEKEHGYIICLDSGNGNELWKYDVQSDLAPLVAGNKPAGVVPDICCSIKTALDEGKIYLVGGTSWTDKNNKDKAEVLMCLDRNGKQLWKKEFHGLPGLISMSNLRIIDKKLVMGNYSYGDDTTGPASVQAFDIKSGELAWKFEIPNDPDLASAGNTNVTVEVVGDKVIAAAHFGKIFILDSKGEKIKEFTAFQPEQNQNYSLYTSVYGGSLAAGKDEIIIAPGSTVVKGASDVKVDIEHSASNSIMVFNLDGEMKWKFRLGGYVSSILVKGNYLLLATMHNENTLDYSYCGVYAFDLTQGAVSSELNAAEESVLDKYIGFYKTDGAVLYNSLGAADDGKVICVTTWPTRTGVDKHGQNSLYILKIN